MCSGVTFACGHETAVCTNGHTVLEFERFIIEDLETARKMNLSDCPECYKRREWALIPFPPWQTSPERKFRGSVGNSPTSRIRPR